MKARIVARVLSRRNWWGMRPLAALAGAAAGIMFQVIAMTGLGTMWAGSYDVMQGECGWDGTCSDAGTIGVTFAGWVVLIAADIIVGGTLAHRVGQRRLVAGNPVRQPGRLLGTYMAVGIGIVCAVTCAVVLQNVLIEHWASDRYPGVAGWRASAQFYFTWNVVVLATEAAILLFWCLSRVLWRRWWNRQPSTAG